MDEALIDQAFKRFLDALSSSPAEGVTTFLDRESPQIRSELRRRISDFKFLVNFFSNASEELLHRRLGGFHFRELIGSGAMGQVWQAQQIGLQRQVAVKVLHPQLCLRPGYLDRFRREAMAGAKVDHPNVAKVYCSGEEEGFLFFAQELVSPGFSLQDWIQQLRTDLFPPEGFDRRVAGLFFKICSGMQEAHRAGICHRDIKPGNILFASPDEPKIVDFGLARVEQDPILTRTGEFQGTPLYMSPEQVKGGLKACSSASDVYSLGATLYETLCLQHPHQGSTLTEIGHDILHERPPAPHRLVPIAKDLSTICMKAMEKNPAKRYSSMDAMAADLNRFVRGEAISAKPAGPLRVARIWCRRHPALSTTMILSMLSALILIMISLELATARNHSLSRYHSLKDFLSNYLRSYEIMHPDKHPAASISITELLDHNYESISNSLQREPELRSALLGSIGHLYTLRQEYDKALPILDEVVASGSAHEPEEFIACLHLDLAAANFACGKLDASREYAQKSYLYFLRQFGDLHDRTLQSELILIQIWISESKWQLARRHLLKLKSLGEENQLPHPILVDVCLKLAQIEIADPKGSSRKGEDLCRQALAALSTEPEAPSVHRINAHLNLASALGRRGQLKQAERHVWLSWQDSMNLFGPNNSETIFASIRLLRLQLLWGNTSQFAVVAEGCPQSIGPFLTFVFRESILYLQRGFLRPARWRIPSE